MLKKMLFCAILGLTACVSSPKEIAKTAVSPLPTPVVVIPPAILSPSPARHITWREASPELVVLAEKSDKFIITFFYNDSDNSNLFRNKILTDVCVTNQIEDNYLFVGVDVTEVPKAAEFLKKHHLTPPIIMLATPDGRMIPQALGYMPPSTYCKILQDLNAKFRHQNAKD